MIIMVATRLNKSKFTVPLSVFLWDQASIPEVYLLLAGGHGLKYRVVLSGGGGSV